MDRHRKKQVSLLKKPKKGRKKKAGFGLPFFIRILTRVSCYPVMFMRLVILNAVTPDLYKYKALRLSYENASIFATFALVAFIPGLPYTHLVILRALARYMKLGSLEP